jgi:hypothetical protein
VSVCLGTPSTQHRNSNNVVLINTATVRNAEKLIVSLEHCNPDGAEIPFDRVTPSDPAVRITFLKPTKCPNGKRKIFEKTLVEAA